MVSDEGSSVMLWNYDKYGWARAYSAVIRFFGLKLSNLIIKSSASSDAVGNRRCNALVWEGVIASNIVIAN